MSRREQRLAEAAAVLHYPERDLNAHGKAWLAWAIGPQRPVPALQVLGKPVGQARLALVTTGGFVPPGAEPFKTGKLGDPTFREIPAEIVPDELAIFHPHFDHEPAKRDINIVFPVPLARELVAEGALGRLADTHYSFMGYVPRTRKLEQIYAPQLAARLKQAEVDAVLLTPAWPTCNRTVGLVARTIEEEGIATVCVMNLRRVAERILAPRTLLVPRPMGAILGEPGHRAGQRAIVMAALRLLEDPTIEAGVIREFRGG